MASRRYLSKCSAEPSKMGTPSQKTNFHGSFQGTQKRVCPAPGSNNPPRRCRSLREAPLPCKGCTGSSKHTSLFSETRKVSDGNAHHCMHVMDLNSKSCIGGTLIFSWCGWKFFKSINTLGFPFPTTSHGLVISDTPSVSQLVEVHHLVLFIHLGPAVG